MKTLTPTVSICLENIPALPPRRTVISVPDTPDLEHYTFWLDGEPLPFCIYANETYGIAICADVTVEPDAAVRFKRDADFRLVPVVHRGRVEIRDDRNPSGRGEWLTVPPMKW